MHGYGYKHNKSTYINSTGNSNLMPFPDENGFVDDGDHGVDESDDQRPGKLQRVGFSSITNTAGATLCKGADPLEFLPRQPPVCSVLQRGMFSYGFALLFLLF